MIHKRISTDEEKVIIAFEIPGSVWADQIHLVGDFNGWNRESLPLWRDERENWRMEVALDRGREYHFRYLIDGDHWRSEWRADRHVEGSDGVYDSVIMARLPGAG